MKHIFTQRWSKERRKNLRKNPTPEEEILWKYLQNKSLGIKFRRQHNIGGYIVDFFAPAQKIVIELDGGIHDKDHVKKYDEVRDSFLRTVRCKILRIKNEDVYFFEERIKEKIIQALNTIPLPASP